PAARGRRPARGAEGPGPPPDRLGRPDKPERPGRYGVRGLAGVEPADPGVAAEPGFLAAGEPPGGLRRLQPGLAPRLPGPPPTSGRRGRRSAGRVRAAAG